jgi:hypothetical protein
MRSLLTRALLTVLALVGISFLAPTPSYADTTCAQTNPATGECMLWVEIPGTSGTPGQPGDDGSKDTGTGAACYWDGTDQGISKPPPGPVPCSSPDGYWPNSYHCYIKFLDPQPSPGDPFWRASTSTTALSTAATSPRPGSSLVSGLPTRRPTQALGRPP